MISAAIVGLGRWGQRYVTSCQGKSDRIRFVRGMIRNPDVAREFAAKHDFTLSANYADVLSDSRVQVIVLATPPSGHLDHIVAAASAGKHVLCEKPLTLTRTDAERAVEACSKARVLLGVGHDKRYLAPMQELRRVVASGALGELLHAEGNSSNEVSRQHYKPWREEESEAPGVSLTATGIHIIDALVSMLGPASSVYGKALLHEEKLVDTVTLFMQMKANVSAVVASARPSPYFWRTHVFGTKGSAEALGETDFVLRMSGEKPKLIKLEPVDTVRASLEAFADGVTGRAPYPMTGDQMIGTIAAFEAAVASMKSGRPVDL